MFSKAYKGKKVLERLTYITPIGEVIRVRNTGRKSNIAFQRRIDNGKMDERGRLRWQMKRLREKRAKDGNPIH